MGSRFGIQKHDAARAAHLGQRSGVVHAVADHGDAGAAALQPCHQLRLQPT